MSTRTVEGQLGFLGDMAVRPRFHANDQALDVLNIVHHMVTIEDARHRTVQPTLDEEGFRLYPHKSAISDFRDSTQLESIHVSEIRDLLMTISGADHVTVNGTGVLRFSERSADSGALNNSRPARFVHIDSSDAAAAEFYRKGKPSGGREVRRSVQYNVWRVVSQPPQDVPLAVCDARSLLPADLVPADAVFDKEGKILFSFESLLLRYSASQRWSFYSDMHPDEVLVFKTNDTDPLRAHHVPHGAFDDPTCPRNAAPRASIEMRGIAWWFA